MTRSLRPVVAVLMVLALGVGIWWLRDPVWAGDLVTGFHDWQEDETGRRYRWTNGHASFFVPSDATRVLLWFRSGPPQPIGQPVTVMVSVDNRWLKSLSLSSTDGWVPVDLQLPSGRSTRRFRRLELRVSPVVADVNRGVMTGEISLVVPSAR